MSELFDAVREVFRSQGWASEEVPDREVLRADFESHHTRVPLHVQAFPEICGVHVVAGSPLRFPESHRAKLAELLVRASQQMTVGNFEMDWEHGAVLFRAVNLFAGPGAVDERIVAGLVHTAVAEVDRLTPLLAILYRCPPGELSGLEIGVLLSREDLLPPAPAAPAEDPRGGGDTVGI